MITHPKHDINKILEENKLTDLIDKDNLVSTCNISLQNKTFRFEKFSSYDTGSDKEQKTKNNELVYDQLQTFINDNSIASIKITTCTYWDNIICYYYTGEIVLATQKTEEGTTNISVKCNSNTSQTIIAMCFNDVCKLCEKQIEYFQSIFIENADKSNIKESVKQISKNIDEQKQKIGLVRKLLNKGKETVEL